MIPIFDLAGPLQLSLLMIMWQKKEQPGAVTVHQITAEHNAFRQQAGEEPLAYTTYLTVMRNLAKRGFVAQTKNVHGRAHLFTVLIPRKLYEERVIKHTLPLFDGDKARFAHAVAVYA